MTKQHAIVSFQLPLAEIALLDAEAQQLAVPVTRSSFMRQIVLDRHHKTIQFDANTDALLEQHELTTLALKTELATQQADQERQVAASAQQRAQLTQAHADELAELSETHQRQTMELFKLDFRYEVQTKHVCQLEADNKQLKEQLAAAKSEKAALKKQLSARQQIETASNVLSQTVGNLLGQAPQLQDHIITNGLGSLWSGQQKAAPMPTPPPTPQAEVDQRLGQAIREDFPANKLGMILTVVQFLRDTPAVLQELLASRAYKLYRAKKKPKNDPS
jgi:DNA polymerase III alpha subunit (gram-positive type)